MTVTKADLQSLLERVEKATGPDREIDALICAELRYHTEANWTPLLDGEWRTDRFGGVGVYPPEGKRLNQPGYSEAVSYGVGSFMAPRLTASIDAAVALVERMLREGENVFLLDISVTPKIGVSLSGAKAGARITFYTERYYPKSEGFPVAEDHAAGAPTGALALCTALLKAIIEAERIGSPSQEQTASEQNKNLPPEAVE